MITLNMNGAPVNITAFQFVCAQAEKQNLKRPAMATVHPEQEAIILGIAAKISDVYLEEIRDKIKARQLPVGAIEVRVLGVPLRVDASIPNSEIRFEDSSGTEVARIEKCAILLGF